MRHSPLYSLCLVLLLATGLRHSSLYTSHLFLLLATGLHPLSDRESPATAV